LHASKAKSQDNLVFSKNILEEFEKIVAKIGVSTKKVAKNPDFYLVKVHGK